MQPADFGVFKPMKKGWKKAVLNFQRQHPTDVITKENFAVVLKTVIDDTKPDIIQHGFRAFGMYPWNSSAINYSKCTGKNNNNNPNAKIDAAVITFNTFKRIMGEEKTNSSRLHKQRGTQPRLFSTFWSLRTIF